MENGVGRNERGGLLGENGANFAVGYKEKKSGQENGFDEGVESVDAVTDDEKELEKILRHGSGCKCGKMGCEFATDFAGNIVLAPGYGMGAMLPIEDEFIADELEANQSQNDAFEFADDMQTDLENDDLENEQMAEIKVDDDIYDEGDGLYGNLSKYSMIPPPELENDIVSGSES